MIATIGIDLQSGQPRYTMGVPELQDGVGFIVVVVGLVRDRRGVLHAWRT